MRFRTIAVAVATTAMMVGPAFVHGALSSVAGAKKECTITGTAADDDLTGTTRDDVICTKAGQDFAEGGEGNDILRGGQGDDELDGEDQNDEIYGGQGDDSVGEDFAPVGEGGNDFLKSRDNVSGNDTVYPDPGTDTCVIDAGDPVTSCEL